MSTVSHNYCKIPVTNAHTGTKISARQIIPVPIKRVILLDLSGITTSTMPDATSPQENVAVPYISAVLSDTIFTAQIRKTVNIAANDNATVPKAR